MEFWSRQYCSSNDDRDDESDNNEIYPSAPHPPAPLDKMVSGFVKTFDNRPRDSSMDLSQANASAFPPQPSQTDTDMEPTDHAPSHGPSPGFPSIAPPVSQMDIIMETNDEIRDTDPILPPQLTRHHPTIDETYQMDVNNLKTSDLTKMNYLLYQKKMFLPWTCSHQVFNLLPSLNFWRIWFITGMDIV